MHQQQWLFFLGSTVNQQANNNTDTVQVKKKWMQWLWNHVGLWSAAVHVCLIEHNDPNTTSVTASNCFLFLLSMCSELWLHRCVVEIQDSCCHQSFPQAFKLSLLSHHAPFIVIQVTVKQKQPRCLLQELILSPQSTGSSFTSWWSFVVSHWFICYFSTQTLVSVSVLLFFPSV